MRRITRQCLAQIIQEASSVSSSCSTSGRQTSGSYLPFARLFASKTSADRFEWFDPSRDVYKQFQRKWDEANAAAAAAKADLEPPPRVAPRHRMRGVETAQAEYDREAAVGAARAQRPRPSPVEKDADWPPGYDEMLREYLREQLSMSGREAAALVEAARRGLLPASRELIRMRYMHIKDLEPRFPGFHAHSAVLSEPRLLRHSASKLMTAMLVFQDQWAAHPVGPLMGRIGKFIVADPIGSGHRLHALARAMASELGVTLDPNRLTRGSVFLTCTAFELDARVDAVATIFGRQGATRLLDADINVLCFEPRELNGSVLALREVFTGRGYGRPRMHHVGTPEGAAEAAADRAYVTELAVAWPSVLQLPGRYGDGGVAAMVAAVAEAGGQRYAGEGGRRELLADVATKPELLLRAAVAVVEASADAETGGEGQGYGEAAERLRQALAAVVKARETVAVMGSAGDAGALESEAIAGMV